MGKCKDPRLTYLNEDGYNVVRLPRVGLEPLDVLGKDERLERLGSITQIWTTDEPPPKPNAPQPVVDLNGQSTASLDLSVGLKILGNILSGMGSAVGLPSLTVGYKNARKVQFTFTNVHAISVDPFAIGRYITKGDLDLNNPFVNRYFGEKDTKEYLVYEVLKSNSVTVTGKSESGTDVKVDIPSIQGAVGANVGVSVSGSSESQVTYTGKDMLTFGFKIFELVFADGTWRVEGVKPSGDLAFADDDEPGESIVLGTGGLVDLSDASNNN